MLKIYTASKISDAHLWHKFCASNPNFIFHARWLKHNKMKTPDTAEFAPDFWLQDEQDVKHSDAVLVLGQEGQHLRGALVEVGIALAWGIPVIIIGDHPDYGTWQFHPGVRKVKDFEGAFAVLAQMEPSYKKMSRPAAL